MVKFVCVVLLILPLINRLAECKRYSSSGSRPSYSRPSYHPSPSYHSPSPSYHSPSPSYHSPSPSYHSPSPSYHSPSPSYHSPAYQPSSYNSPSYHSSPTHTSVARPSQPAHTPSHSSPSVQTPSRSSPSDHRPPTYDSPPGGYPSFKPHAVAATQRPLGFQPPNFHPSGAVGPPKNVAPVGNEAGGSSNSRPIGFVPAVHSQSAGSSTQRPIGFVPPGSPGHGNQPIGPPKTVGTQGNAPPPYQANPPPYNPNYNPAGYGPPAYTPHQNPAGYGPPAYTPHQNPAGYGPPAYTPYHNPGYGPPSGYNPGYSPGYGHYSPGTYHAPGAGGVTIVNQNINNNHHYGGGGGYGGYPSYHYTPVDTGSGTLGFFLGYSLAKLTTPSYHYHSGYSSYSQAPVYDHYEVHHYYHNNQNVPKVAEIQQNAIVGCVGDAGSFCPSNTTSLCTNNGAVMCVASATTTVPCSNEKQTNCVKTTVPCVNSSTPECINSQRNTTTLSIPCISTAKVYGNLSFKNNSIVIANTTAISTNASTVNVTTSSNATVLPETTTPNTQTSTSNSQNITSTSSTNTTNSTVEKKEPPQVFCVTILALPAERKPPEGEVLINSAKSIFGKFAVKALGIE